MAGLAAGDVKNMEVSEMIISCVCYAAEIGLVIWSIIRSYQRRVTLRFCVFSVAIHIVIALIPKFVSFTLLAAYDGYTPGAGELVRLVLYALSIVFVILFLILRERGIKADFTAKCALLGSVILPGLYTVPGFWNYTGFSGAVAILESACVISAVGLIVCLMFVKPKNTEEPKEEPAEEPKAE